MVEYVGDPPTRDLPIGHPPPDHSKKSEYIAAEGRWCGLPDPSAMSTYVLSDFRPYRDDRCDPCRSTQDEWDEDDNDDNDDGGDDWDDDEPLHPTFDHATRNRHVQVWDGYGVGSSTIDCDAMMRMATEDASLMGRADGRQLSSRVFVAAPSLAMKRPDPTKELSVITGIDTSETRRCYRLGEEVVDRFDPGVCAVPVEHIIPPWVVGGAFSRDISRDPKFQRAVRKAAAAVRCDDRGPEGAPDPSSLFPFGIFGIVPSDSNAKVEKKKSNAKEKDSKKAAKAWIKLETMAAALPLPLSSRLPQPQA